MKPQADSEEIITQIGAHTPLWERFEALIKACRMPQSVLLLGSKHAQAIQFANRLIARLLCQVEALCGQCDACKRLARGTHPDIHFIGNSEPSKAITIEPIRALQQTIYQTPQRGKYRFVVLNPAEKMNVSAANALLKILEEPPAHTIFILIAEQISTMLPTILSRCQRYVIPDLVLEKGGYLAIGHLYPKDSSRAVLFQNGASLIESICDVIERKSTPCAVAALWSEYSFEDLLWWLYLVNAEAIHYQMTLHSLSDRSCASQIAQLAELTQPFNLLQHLDKIYAFIDKTNHNIPINQNLALESLLLDYISHE